MFKKILIWIAAFFALLPSASAYTEYGWQIDRFDVDAFIAEDASMMVVERIQVDFFDLERRGILRDIPVIYENNEDRSFDIAFELLSVLDESGEPREYVVETSGRWKTIRIGNASIWITGPQTYVIAYKVNRTYVEGENTLEYFWNVTGSFPVPIIDSRFSMHLPNTVSSQSVEDMICFTGYFAETSSDCKFYREDAKNRITFVLDRPLESEEQFSAAILLPKEGFSMPGMWTRFWWWLQMHWPMVVFWVLGVVILLLWWFKGREHAKGSSVPSWNPPEGMLPFEVGILEDDRSKNDEIAATLIYFATRGWMKIIRNASSSYTFKKLQEPTDTLPEAELAIWNGLFKDRNEVSTTKLKYSFYSTITKAHRLAYELVTNKKWYYSNPDEISTMYSALGWIVLIVGVIFAIVMEHGGALIWAIIVGVLWIVLAIAMPKKTIAGMKQHEAVLGLKEYISRAEKYTLEFFNAPEKSPEEFERLLPFAMVLGVEKKWAKEFKDIYEHQPDWYEGDIKNFSTTRFVNQLNSFASTAHHAMTVVSKPSSGSSSYSSFSSSGGSSFSGGFSGGGFGGGGGGSW